MRTRREMILLAALSALLVAAPSELALAKGGDNKGGNKNGDDARPKDDKAKTKKPKEPKLDEKFKTAVKAAKKHLGEGEDGVKALLAGLGEKDKIELDLNSKKPTNFSKKQADTRLRDWLKKNTLTIGKRRSVANGKSVSWDLEIRNPKKRAGTIRLTFAKSGKSYRLRGIVIQAK